MTLFWFVICISYLQLQLAAVCTVQHAACYCFYCWWVMIHLSLNLESRIAARVAVGKFVVTLCQAFVPIRCVWWEGSHWHLAGPLPILPTLSLKHDNDVRGRVRKYSLIFAFLNSVYVPEKPLKMREHRIFLNHSQMHSIPEVITRK